jgi:trimethylamine---corrinoid protein Co-methyltransferase
MDVTKIEARKLSRLGILNQEDLIRIHDASVRVLEETGMVFHSEKALAILKKHGAAVSGKTARIPRQMIEKALELCPPTVKWRARNAEKTIVVGRGLHAQAGGGSTNIEDLENGRRPSKLEDFTNIQKLYQSSRVIDVVGFTPVDAGDVDPAFKHLHMQREILRHTDKPVHGHVCGGRQAGQMLDMIEIAFGEEKLLKNNHVIGLSINTISPLGFGEDQLDTLIEYVSRNQIIIAAPLAIGGATAPMSHAGMTVLVNAEILAMIVLVQLLNPGNPVIIGPSSSFADMRTGAYAAGIPDGMLHIVTQVQLSRELYNIPTRVLAGACDAKMVDAQAGFETMQNLMISILAGADMVAHVCGVLDGIMTISYEKMIIDEELLRRAIYFRERSVDISEEALSVDIINEVGPEGTFLLHRSVFDNCRDFFQTDVSDWSNYSEWKRTGSRDIAAKANQIFRERLASAPDSLLDAETGKDLDQYVTKVTG